MNQASDTNFQKFLGSRCVPELTSDKNCIEFGDTIDGIYPVETGSACVQSTSNNYHILPPYANYPPQKCVLKDSSQKHHHLDNDRLREEATTCNHLTQGQEANCVVYKPCDDVVYQPPTRDPLYDLEDGLRYTINTQIEEFRFHMQHTLTDHFSEYHALQPAAKYARCDDALDCKDGMPIGLLGCTGTGEVGMASHHAFHNESTSNTESTSSKVDDDDDSESKLMMESLLDKYVIELQTCAALITSTLRHSEFSLHS